MQITALDGVAPLSQQDLAGLAEAPRAIMKAWGDHDAAAFADVFLSEGSMVLPGHEVVGKEAISQFMAGAFEGPYNGTQVVGEPVRLTVLSSDQVLMFTEGGVRDKAATELTKDQKVRATWTMVRTDEGWRLAAYQNTTMVPA